MRATHGTHRHTQQSTQSKAALPGTSQSGPCALTAVELQGQGLAVCAVCARPRAPPPDRAKIANTVNEIQSVPTTVGQESKIYRPIFTKYRLPCGGERSSERTCHSIQHASAAK